MGASIQARLDKETEHALARLARRLGWSPSRVVREGVRRLAACHAPKGRRTILGQGKFRSGIGDPGLQPGSPSGLGKVKPVLLDTGPIVALLDPSDSFHQSCAQVIASICVPLVTCEAVITESCYLLHRLKGAPEAVLENVVAEIFSDSCVTDFMWPGGQSDRKQVPAARNRSCRCLPDPFGRRIFDRGYSHAGSQFSVLSLGPKPRVSSADSASLKRRSSPRGLALASFPCLGGTTEVVPSQTCV